MKFKYIIALIWVGIIGNACAQNTENSNADVKNLSASEFKDQITAAGIQLIDIRTPDEYNQGHIDGATLINFYAPDFKEKMNMLDKSKPVLIYCRSGNRSGKSVQILKDLGFQKIVNLRSGIIDWQRNGYELVR